MTQKLVLVGGGHAHAIALREWGLNPLPGVELVLISDVEQTPYSGMLPGHVAGFYSYEATHIDLPLLARFAGAKLIRDRAVGINPEKNQLSCTSGSINYDYLSLDIGSTPQAIGVMGAPEYAIPAKPVPGFLHAWYELKTAVVANPRQEMTLVIVGGGAGGVELALNMQTCLEKMITSPQQLKIHLVHRGQQLLSGHNDWVRHKLTSILQQRGIQLHLGEEVVEVQADQIICDSGLVMPAHQVFWITQASAPVWIKESSLTTDDQGFILVQDTLQSVSHANILAAGDIATMINYSRPKAGVFAVRQGKPLFANWQHLLQHQELAPYLPQDKYLALIGTADRRAIASWSRWGWYASWLWWLKDYIDRKFMEQFASLVP